MYPQWQAAPPTPQRRPGPSIGWAVVALWAVAGGFLAGALLFAAMAVLGFSHDARLEGHGVTTTATVTDCDGTEVMVDFTSRDGERISGDYISWPNQVSPA
ncbi:MAG TPA: hypothetical protein VHH12_03605, partial [Mycobacterium sp.]|nr:hypothetical protein [Mycobacterium sp.]